MLEFLPQMCSLYYMFLQIGEHLLIRPDFNGIQCFCVWKAMNFIVSMISLFFCRGPRISREKCVEQVTDAVLHHTFKVWQIKAGLQSA
jgi:hypothetical protein